MDTTGSLHCTQPTFAGDEATSLKKKIEIVRAACAAAAEAMELLSGAELDVLVRSQEFGQNVDFYELVRKFESQLIKRALRHSHGVQIKAARMLNIKPTTLNNKIKVYDIRPEPYFLPIRENPASTEGLGKTRADLVA